MTLQASLAFDPPAAPLPVLNPTAPTERKVALQRACLRILDRLCRGPATNREMLAIGGQRFGARLGELRRYIRQWGLVIPEPRENKTTGEAIYWLEGGRS